jgi:sugar fermentation stimulation protein A
MGKILMQHGKPLVKGTIIERLNRFTIQVKIGKSIENVYLPNPGRLSTVIARGREVLCERVGGRKRKTRFNAFAVKLRRFYVTINSSLANILFSAALEKGVLRCLKGYALASREQRLPTYGRIDFILRNPKGKLAYVEVKSCTHVEDGIAKFPDRQTERGRRHLRALSGLASKGLECYLFFIVQRPDARLFKPFKEVDPEFAELLKRAIKAGVRVGAITTRFKPPNQMLIANPNLPIKFE